MCSVRSHTEINRPVTGVVGSLHLSVVNQRGQVCVFVAAAVFFGEGRGGRTHPEDGTRCNERILSSPSLFVCFFVFEKKGGSLISKSKQKHSLLLVKRWECTLRNLDA